MVVSQSRSRYGLIWSRCSVLAAWSGCFGWYAKRTVQRGFKNIYRKCEVTTESNPKFKSSRAIPRSCPITKEFWKNLPQGINTLVGEKGSFISTGQKQRINIARAFYNNVKVLILDESTNSLDDNTEQVLLNEIHKLKSKKTFDYKNKRRK